MFSGIVEAQSDVREVSEQGNAIQIIVGRPAQFLDLNLGDSIACNGVCLTLEKQTPEQLYFTLGAETLEVTGWSVAQLQRMKFNLERSLRLNDRLHGHMVTGHVEAVAKVVSIQKDQSWNVVIEVPRLARHLVWEKGSLTLNGVSLTINSIQNQQISFCLIPETLQRTNLGQVQLGDSLNVEYDVFAKAVANYEKYKPEVLP